MKKIFTMLVLSCLMTMTAQAATKRVSVTSEGIYSQSTAANNATNLLKSRYPGVFNISVHSCYRIPGAPAYRCTASGDVEVPKELKNVSVTTEGPNTVSNASNNAINLLKSRYPGVFNISVHSCYRIPRAPAYRCTASGSWYN